MLTGPTLSNTLATESPEKTQPPKNNPERANDKEAAFVTRTHGKRRQHLGRWTAPLNALLTAVLLGGCLLSLLHNGQSLAGPISSGGGKAVVCPKNGAHKLTVLDVFEAHREHGAIHATMSGDISKDFQSLLQAYWSLRDAYARPMGEVSNAAQEEFDDLWLALRWVPEGSLETTHDALPRYPLPRACHLVQMAVQSTDDRGVFTVRIDEQLWGLADPLNRAALLLHEWIYRQERLQGVATSDLTRLLVGHTLWAAAQDQSD
jgi:hypothetical protein